MSVAPYWELTFDASGDPDPAQRDALLDGLRAHRVTDAVFFCHGWNNDRDSARALFGRFFAPFPRLLGRAPSVRVGYVGVVWPSMRFSDEPIPDFPATPLRRAAARGAPGAVLPGPRPGAPPGPGLDAATKRALLAVFPDRRAAVERAARLLDHRPPERRAFEEFGAAVREVAGVPGGAGLGPLVPGARVPGGALPAMLTGDPVEVCRGFTVALGETGLPVTGPEERRSLFSEVLTPLWHGAREVLRQAAYWAMKRRAGTIGRHGLGPALGEIGRSCPEVRVHLVGHSFGARLVAYALPALEPGSETVRSVTLLQGAFSHYAFADHVPLDADEAGGLRDAQDRVAGPVVACWSSHDTALGVWYPLASRLTGDDASVLGPVHAAPAAPGGSATAGAPGTAEFGLGLGELGHLTERFGALGHDGVRAVPDSVRLTLAEALTDPFPARGCVSVDASSVVRHGGPPTGAHSDICHPELARVVLRAGRIPR
jgi:hypothetical protein